MTAPYTRDGLWADARDSPTPLGGLFSPELSPHPFDQRPEWLHFDQPWSPVGNTPIPQPLAFQGRINDATAAPDQRPWYAKLQEGLMPVPHALEGLLTDDDIKNARAQGVLGLGLSLLDSAAPSPTRVPLGQALARGLQTGMGGYQQHLMQSAQLDAQAQQ